MLWRPATGVSPSTSQALSTQRALVDEASSIMAQDGWARASQAARLQATILTDDRTGRLDVGEGLGTSSLVASVAELADQALTDHEKNALET